MKYFKLYTLLFFFSFLTNSCHEVEVISDDIDIPGLGGTTEAQNELDLWLYENFTKPYNIEVVYRWDAAQMYTNIYSKLVPIKYQTVKPLMEALAKVWFDPFNKSVGEDFLKSMAPKKVVLVGSPEYTNGAMKLGQAEGGRKILLLNANAFDVKDEAGLRTMLETIIHEFAHILHQSVLYDKSFQTISAGHYDATGWHIQQPNGVHYAYERGFVSKYAMSAHEEDFVEVFTMVTVRGMDWYRSEVLPVAQASRITDADEALQAKIDLLEDYLLEAWGIRLFDDPVSGEKGFESYMQQAIKEVTGKTPTH